MGEIVLLDVDGPIVKLDITTAQLVNPKYTDQDLKDLDNWDIFSLFTEDELKICHELWKDPSFWRNLPINETSLKAVEKIKQLGGEVVFVTSPWEPCKEWDDARRALLKQHFNATRNEIIITSRKDLIYGDVFIDDRLDNVVKWNVRWKGFGKNAIMFETFTNYKTDFFPRMVIENNEWRIKQKNE